MDMTFKQALQQLLERKDFTHDEMLEIMRMMMAGAGDVSCAAAGR